MMEMLIEFQKLTRFLTCLNNFQSFLISSPCFFFPPSSASINESSHEMKRSIINHTHVQYYQHPTEISMEMQILNAKANVTRQKN